MMSSLTKWAAGPMIYASPEGRFVIEGVSVYRGLALFPAAYQVGGLEPPKITWSVTHADSGYRVCLLDGQAASSMLLAEELAEAADWTAPFDVVRVQEIYRAVVRGFRDRHGEVKASSHLDHKPGEAGQ